MTAPTPSNDPGSAHRATALTRRHLLRRTAATGLATSLAGVVARRRTRSAMAHQNGNGSTLIVGLDGSPALNNRLQVFTPDGEVLGAVGSFGADPEQFHCALGLALDEDGAAYVSDRPRVQAFRVVLPNDGQPIP